MLFFSLEVIIAHTKYGDPSATYWELYNSKAEIYDKNFVDSSKGDTESVVFLVSDDANLRLQVYIAVSYDCLTELFVLRHRRIIYHRNIQDAPTQQWSELIGYPPKYRRSHQYCAVSQPLPERYERTRVCSRPAMV